MGCWGAYDFVSEKYAEAYEDNYSGPGSIEVATEAAIAAARSCIASLKGMHRDHESISYVSETHLRKNHPELFQNGKFILEPKD